MKKKKDYILIAEIHSFTEPEKLYKIKMDNDAGTLSCNCPSWIFFGDPDYDNDGNKLRACKHTRLFLDAVGKDYAQIIAWSGESVVEMYGTSWKLKSVKEAA
jgi:hypothetical protein